MQKMGDFNFIQQQSTKYDKKLSFLTARYSPTDAAEAVDTDIDGHGEKGVRKKVTKVVRIRMDSVSF